RRRAKGSASGFAGRSGPAGTWLPERQTPPASREPDPVPNTCTNRTPDIRRRRTAGRCAGPTVASRARGGQNAGSSQAVSQLVRVNQQVGLGNTVVGAVAVPPDIGLVQVNRPNRLARVTDRVPGLGDF